MYSHLGHVTFYTKFHSPFLTMLHIKFGFILIGRAVSEKMFENYGQIHVYSPGAGADNPLVSFFFHKYKSSVHLHTPSNFPPFNYILLIFPHSNALAI